MPNTAAIILFDLLSVILIYLLQTCSVLYAARLHAHQVGELARQDIYSQATLFIPATKHLGGFASASILLILVLTTLLRYLATLLSWKFSPIVVGAQRTLEAVTLSWPTPGSNNYSAVCNAVYNCSSEHPGTEALISSTLLNSCIAQIYFPPILAEDIDWTVQHHGYSVAKIYIIRVPGKLDLHRR